MCWKCWMCGGKTICRADIFSTFSCFCGWGYISGWKSVWIRIIFRLRMHPWLEKCPDKDYFEDGGCIPDRRNARIRIIFRPRMHPWSEKCSDKDYFSAVDASLNEEMFGQGLFFGWGCIPDRRNVWIRIIFRLRMHLWLKKCPDKDYFGAADAFLVG